MLLSSRIKQAAASFGLLTLALPGMAGAAINSSTVLNFGIDLDAYSDGPWNDVSTNIAVSALTDIGVLRGNDDGTFRPDRTLNRAEFMTIIMRMSDEETNVNLRCFPDVSSSAWYAEAVCRAKAAGIVRGNAIAGVDASQWKFEPNRPVQYEEAVKVLMKEFAIPIIGNEDGMDWYVPFLQEANEEDLDLEGKVAGQLLTRGEMARLTVAFVAFGTGQLDELRMAERGSSSSSSSVSSSSSSSSRSTSSSSSSSSTVGSGVFDQLNDITVRDNIIVLGSTSPIIGGVEFFSNDEPVTADRITVDFTGNVDSISAVQIYGDDSQLIATAFETSTQGTFSASVPDGYFNLPRREDAHLYFRVVPKNRQSGGVSGEEVRIDSITLQGTGEWTNDSYTTTSTDTFNTYTTAHGGITSVERVGASDGVLVSGASQLLGTFEFEGESADSLYETRLTQVEFTSNATGNVQLNTVYLTTDDGSNVQASCSVSGNTITCASLPVSIGTVDGSRIIRIYADVSGVSANDSLQLRIADAGTPTAAGDITWTDGETTFMWVPLDNPVVQGPVFD